MLNVPPKQIFVLVLVLALDFRVFDYDYEDENEEDSSVQPDVETCFRSARLPS